MVGHGNVVYGRRSVNGKPLMPRTVLIHRIIAARRAVLRTIVESSAAAVLMQDFKKTIGLLGRRKTGNGRSRRKPGHKRMKLSSVKRFLSIQFWDRCVGA